MIEHGHGARHPRGRGAPDEIDDGVERLLPRVRAAEPHVRGAVVGVEADRDAVEHPGELAGRCRAG